MGGNQARREKKQNSSPSRVTHSMIGRQQQEDEKNRNRVINVVQFGGSAGPVCKEDWIAQGTKTAKKGQAS